jgi:CDGSH-type Zn-finger protein
MDQCPKCLSSNITGPRFERGAYGGEALRYTCCRCGYSRCKPTADSYDKMPHPWAQTAAAPEKAGSK